MSADAARRRTLLVYWPSELAPFGRVIPSHRLVRYVRDLGADMMIEPRDVAARVPACPRCGEKHFTYVMGSGLPPKVEKIRCAQCGANILRAYRAAQPAPFGLTVGQLDRLALLVGVLLLAVLLLRLSFVR